MSKEAINFYLNSIEVLVFLALKQLFDFAVFAKIDSRFIRILKINI